MTPIVVLFSGGINSAVTAARYAEGAALHLLHLDHGQPAAGPERVAARKTAEALAGTLHAIDLGEAAVDSTPQPADTESPISHTKQIQRASTGMMFLLAGVAQRLARQVGAEIVACGTSELCDDASRESPNATGDLQRSRIFQRAVAIAIEMSATPKRRITWETPFIDVDRRDILRVGMRLGTPFHLTWSCETAGPTPCERCRGCRSRVDAFEAVGQPDPALTGARP